jgi:hypothetical protein
MKCGKETGILPHYYFPLKGREILYQERKRQVNIIVVEHFNSILFQKSGRANKQHTIDYGTLSFHKPRSWLVIVRIIIRDLVLFLLQLSASSRRRWEVNVRMVFKEIDINTRN